MHTAEQVHSTGRGAPALIPAMREHEQALAFAESVALPGPDARAPVRPVVVCSFHTNDDYYAGHARELGVALDNLGLAHRIHAVHPAENEDWADVTRRKIGLVRDTCRQNPGALVLWIDVDCRLLRLPDYVRSTTADFIGFQRSFRSPLHIGYANRNRFWEPSFWGINATEGVRMLIEDAYALEQRSTLKATDDYFLEEAWRANARNLTFQVIPSTAIVRHRTLAERDRQAAFFEFGSSGNVAQFRSRVVQHGGTATPSVRKKALAKAKKLEGALPDEARRPLRRLADAVGITDLLTSDTNTGLDPQRSKDMRAILGAGLSGQTAQYRQLNAEFDNRYVPSAAELVTREVAEALLDYSDRGADQTLRLSWWSRPYPGNFGDWLSPLIFTSATPANLRLQPVTKATKTPHLFGVGSIGRFIRPSSVVVGTGVSRSDVQISKKALFVSVRGPLTAAVVRASGGPPIHRFGDPAVLLSRVVPIQRGHTNGRIAFVRHFSHLDAPIRLPEHVDELSVLMSRRADIEAFLRELAGYDAVVTSTLHVMIAAQSYGIPCGLVTFDGFESAVHGEGIKYEDYARGAEVEVMTPQVVDVDLRKVSLDGLIRDIAVSEQTKDTVAEHVARGISKLERRLRKAGSH